MSDDIRKKSLRDLLPKEDFDQVARRPAAKRKAPAEVFESSEPRLADRYNFNEDRPERKKARPSLLLWLCVLVILVFSGYYLSTFLAKATLTITPRQSMAKIDGQFEASKAPAAGIEYSVIKLSDSAQSSIPANGQTNVSSKAKGTVVITNNFSSATQKLLAGTRLTSSTGLIFRLDKAVVVPAKGKNISVTVTADAAGANFNVPAGEFKIVGFKGTAKYDGFVVKSATAMSGGAQGVVAVVAAADRTKAVSQATMEIKNRLVKKAELQIPKDYIMYPDGKMFTVTDSISNGSASSSANLTVSVQMIAILLNTKNLSESLAAKHFTTENVDGVMISDPAALSFKLLGKEQFDINKTNSIDFELSGTPNFVWPLDTGALKNKLSGKRFKDRDTIFAATPNIYRAVAVIRPFWVLNFPANPSRITVKLSSTTTQ